MINIKEIKEKCPKAYELLKQYIGNSLVEMQKRMANNVGSVKIEEIPPVDDRIIEGILVWNQRTLFDFFDSKEVYISIQETGAGDWQYDVGEAWSTSENSRIEAEEAAYNAAFESLEKIS